jgi:ATP-dependent helicase/DNAse subunit B
MKRIKKVIDALKSGDEKILLSDIATDFNVFTKTEHKFEIFDVKQTLEYTLHQILDEINLSFENKKYIFSEMKCRFDKWL